MSYVPELNNRGGVDKLTENRNKWVNGWIEWKDERMIVRKIIHAAVSVGIKFNFVSLLLDAVCLGSKLDRKLNLPQLLCCSLSCSFMISISYNINAYIHV